VEENETWMQNSCCCWRQTIESKKFFVEPPREDEIEENNRFPRQLLKYPPRGALNPCPSGAKSNTNENRAESQGVCRESATAAIFDLC
jgi:hypothetical protein